MCHKDSAISCPPCLPPKVQVILLRRDEEDLGRRRMRIKPSVGPCDGAGQFTPRGPWGHTRGCMSTLRGRSLRIQEGSGHWGPLRKKTGPQKPGLTWAPQPWQGTQGHFSPGPKDTRDLLRAGPGLRADCPQASPFWHPMFHFDL